MLKRRHVIAGFAAGLAAPAVVRAADTPALLVAEPSHGTGYLPLYIAMRNGYFDGLNVRSVTIESAAGHINAVLSNQAFAFIGGPEHNAFARLKGAEIRAVANVVDRGNVYLVAKAGLELDGGDLAGAFKGRTIAGGFYGGTPNSITRFLCLKAGLKLGEDLKIIETSGAPQLAAMRAGAAQLATVTEPVLTQGIRAGIWGEPFYNVPRALGPYDYSTLNVRKDAIDRDPDVVQRFVRGVMKGLAFTYAHPAEAAAVARADFPTMNPDDLKATLDRSFADEMWSQHGTVSEQAWATAKSVVMAAGLLKQDVPYGDIIDMSFVARA